MSTINDDSAWDSIFVQPWWLDAVAPGSWEQVQVQAGDEIVARLPYMIQKRRGLTFLSMPPLTQTLGPCLKLESEKEAHRLSQEKKLVTQLISQLPRFDVFNQTFHRTVTNWLPFYWQGFEQTTRYSYRLENLNDPDSLWTGLRKNIRTDIRKAEKQVHLRHDLSLDVLLDLVELSFQRQGLHLPYSRDFVYRLDTACQSQKCRKVFFAEDMDGKVHAALYLIWDASSAYYLIGGGDPELRNSGAMSFLVWHAIQFASTVTRAFDFEGSMIEPIERFFRSFGAAQTPYFQITKTNSLQWKIPQDVRKWWKLMRDG